MVTPNKATLNKAKNCYENPYLFENPKTNGPKASNLGKKQAKTALFDSVSENVALFDHRKKDFFILSSPEVSIFDQKHSY